MHNLEDFFNLIYKFSFIELNNLYKFYTLEVFYKNHINKILIKANPLYCFKSKLVRYQIRNRGRGIEALRARIDNDA